MQVELLDLIKLVRSSGTLLLDHFGLTLELALAEWREERTRLRQLAVGALVALLLLGLALLHLSALVLVAAWNTPYRLHAAAALAALYTLAALLAWRRLLRQAALPAGFAASRRELAQTVELLKSRL